MKSLEDCFNKGLRRVTPDIENAKRSLVTSMGHLEDADVWRS